MSSGGKKSEKPIKRKVLIQSTSRRTKKQRVLAEAKDEERKSASAIMAGLGCKLATTGTSKQVQELLALVPPTLAKIWWRDSDWSEENHELAKRANAQEWRNVFYMTLFWLEIAPELRHFRKILSTCPATVLWKWCCKLPIFQSSEPQTREQLIHRISAEPMLDTIASFWYYLRHEQCVTLENVARQIFEETQKINVASAQALTDVQQLTYVRKTLQHLKQYHVREPLLFSAPLIITPKFPPENKQLRMRITCALDLATEEKRLGETAKTMLDPCLPDKLAFPSQWVSDVLSFTYDNNSACLTHLFLPDCTASVLLSRAIALEQRTLKERRASAFNSTPISDSADAKFECEQRYHRIFRRVQNSSEPPLNMRQCLSQWASGQSDIITYSNPNGKVWFGTDWKHRCKSDVYSCANENDKDDRDAIHTVWEIAVPPLSSVLAQVILRHHRFLPPLIELVSDFLND